MTCRNDALSVPTAAIVFDYLTLAPGSSKGGHNVAFYPQDGDIVIGGELATTTAGQGIPVAAGEVWSTSILAGDTFCLAGIGGAVDVRWFVQGAA